MTLSYNRANTELTITSTLLTTYIAVPASYTIDIILNDTSVETAPATDPYVATAVAVDTVYKVIVKLTTTATGAVQIDTGCIFAEGDSADDCASYFGSILTYADTNKEIVSEQTNKILLYYNLLTKAELCPCKCDELKVIKEVLDEEIKDCC